MRFVVLSSGSKGNTTYIECGNTKLIIDMGNNCKYVVKNLEEIGVKPDEIDGILITHTHVDHVKGLKVFVHRFGTKVYCTKKVKDDLDFVTNYELITLDVDGFNINDVAISVMKMSHDAPECVGYIISYCNQNLVYITDTGYINEKYYSMLENASVYILESNHDIEMLSNGRYPFHLRQRILGDKGHISNYDCSRYLSLFLGSRTKYIVLAHLSEENNTPLIAYETLCERLSLENKKIPSIVVAKQDERTEVIEV